MTDLVSGPSGADGIPDVSVIVPTYDEAENVPVLLDRVRQALAGTAFEVIVVDDDSPDRTWAVAQSEAAHDHRVRVLRRIGRRGLAGAVVEGMEAARGDVLVVMDGDLQHDPAVLPQLVARVAAGDDVCVAARGDYGDWPLPRRALSWVATRLARVVVPELSDPLSGYFAVSRSYFEEVAPRLNPRGFKILLEITTAGREPPHVAEVGYEFHRRERGESKLVPATVMHYLADVASAGRARLTPGRLVLGFPPWLVGLLLATVVVALQVRGPDLPAQLFRVELFRDQGFALWNGLWYGGHHILGYSVLFPPLGALVGPTVVGVVSTVAATLLFARIVEGQFGRRARLGAVWFAVSAVINLAVGRLTFALGMAIGLGAILAWQRRNLVGAVALAVMTPLASPVAGAFLGLCAISVGLARFTDHRARPGGFAVTMAVAAIAPVLLLAALFPTPGVFPFPATSLLPLLLTAAGVLLFVPPTQKSLRIGAVVGVVVVLVLFVVPNPLGGNVRRLAELFGGPVVAAAALPRHRLLLAVVALPVLLWQGLFAVDGFEARRDPAADPAYYAPLVTFLESTEGPIGRVEIPFTRQHWETAYVASEIPLARGWERQFDIATNDLFYEDVMDPAEYHQWLLDYGVRFVALPDTDLDYSAEGEAALLRQRHDWLRPVWTNSNWQVFEVTDWEPIVTDPATAVALDAETVRFHVDVPATVQVKVHYTPHWSLEEGVGCARATADGFTEVEVIEPGWFTLAPQLDWVPFGHDEYCTQSEVPEAVW
jgi:hypothetical protein